MRTGIALMTFGFVIARIGVWLRALAMTQRGPELHHFGTAWIGAAFVALGADRARRVSNATLVRSKASSRSIPGVDLATLRRSSAGLLQLFGLRSCHEENGAGERECDAPVLTGRETVVTDVDNPEEVSAEPKWRV